MCFYPLQCPRSRKAADVLVLQERKETGAHLHSFYVRVRCTYNTVIKIESTWSKTLIVYPIPTDSFSAVGTSVLYPLGLAASTHARLSHFRLGIAIQSSRYARRIFEREAFSGRRLGGKPREKVVDGIERVWEALTLWSGKSTANETDLTGLRKGHDAGVVTERLHLASTC